MARFNHHLHHQQQADAAAAAPAVATAAAVATPAAPAGTAPAFADLGVTFNDATRALEGGLWQSAVNEGGQGFGSLARYTKDLTSVQEGLKAEIQAGQFSGDTLAHVQTVLSDISTAMSAANASVNGGGAFGGVAAAEAALRNAHLDLLNVIHNDPALAGLATQNGGTGFAAAPATLPEGTTAANAPHATLAELGAIFNDAASRMLGGVNADNAGIITHDINAVIKGMKELVHAEPDAFQNLTGVHADAVIRQLELEKTYIHEAVAGTNPVVGRGSNDNMLDIIDIIQGDDKLAAMAHQDGGAGFTPFPDALNPTPKYLDNMAQTNFWANFIAQSNSLGQRATELVGSDDHKGIAALIHDLKAFEKQVTQFDAAQGGIFEARFDNELLGHKSTLGAEVSAMIKGLHSGNAALVSAAAEQMHANAADVGGNNIPATGGTYNPDGLTVAQVLPSANGGAGCAGTPVANAPAAPDQGQHLPADPTGSQGLPHPSPAELAQHFHHMWG